MRTRVSKSGSKTGNKEKQQRITSGQVIDCVITGMNAEGLGSAVVEGMPLLVRGAFPDELVRAKVTFVGRREAFADVVKILRRAPVRMARPSCDRGIDCEGCPFISMQYPAQLAWKKELVENCLRPYASLRPVTVLPVLPSDKPLGYRNSAKLVVSGKFAAPVIGIYRPNSHEVVDIDSCPLHHPLINRVAQAVKDGIKKGKVPIYSPRSGQGILRYLVVRVAEASNRAMVVFVTARRSFNEIHHLAKFLRERVPEVAVVAQNVNSSTGNVILGQHDFFVTREQTLVDKIGDITFTISPRSFFQVNNSGARSIYEKVREWSSLSGRESVVDVYCGVGGISLFLAGGAREVYGCESVSEAVSDAEKNSRLNGIRNCRFEAGDAAELLAEMRDEGKKADLLVLNPPRKGCEEKVLQNVAALQPAKIIYVSCSPVTLARDLDILSGLGYQTLHIQPVDMFPQTVHVENVALLVKPEQR